jgi:hypothetical protein
MGGGSNIHVGEEGTNLGVKNLKGGVKSYWLFSSSREPLSNVPSPAVNLFAGRPERVFSLLCEHGYHLPSLLGR